jgi:hypothetical protein
MAILRSEKRPPFSWQVAIILDLQYHPRLHDIKSILTS